MSIVKTIPISLFKAKALQLLEDVRSLKKDIIVTKRGEAIARVSPIDADNQEIKMGHLKGTLSEVGDIITPIDSDIWGVLKK